jgi:Protein of unknown function (DUF3105)
MSSSEHRGLRRVARLAVAFVVALAAVTGLIVFLSSRDTSHVSTPARGPGQSYPDQGHKHLRPGPAAPGVAYNSNPPTSGPHLVTPVTRDGVELSIAQILSALEAGNVIFFYGTAVPPPALRALADHVAGPFDATLSRNGQAVILARRPQVKGVVAAAWRHLLRVPSPTDPALSEFAGAWLGVGAGGK